MAKRHKDFSGGQSLEDYEPLTFTLNEEEFECRPAIQGKTLLQFVAHADSDRGGEAAEALYGFFEKCMEEAEYKRFMDMLDDPRVIVPLETIGEIATWLVEEYTARPTEPSASSQNGRTTSGRTSTGRASKKASASRN